MVDRQFKVRTRAAKAENRVCRRRRDLLTIMIATLSIGSSASAQAPPVLNPHVPSSSREVAPLGSIRQNPYVVSPSQAQNSQIRLTSGQQERTPSSMRLRPIGSANGLHAIHASRRPENRSGLQVESTGQAKVQNNLHLRSLHHDRGTLSRAQVTAVPRLPKRAVSPAFGVTESGRGGDVPGYFEQPGTFARQAVGVPAQQIIRQAAGEVVESADPISFSLSDDRGESKSTEPVRSSAPLVSRDAKAQQESELNQQEGSAVAEAIEFSLSDLDTRPSTAPVKKTPSQPPAKATIRELPAPPDFSSDPSPMVVENEKPMVDEQESSEPVKDSIAAEPSDIAKTPSEPTTHPSEFAMAPSVAKTEAPVEPFEVEAVPAKVKEPTIAKPNSEETETVTKVAKPKPRKIPRAKRTTLEVAQGYVFGDEPEIGQAKPISLNESAVKNSAGNPEQNPLLEPKVVTSPVPPPAEEQSVDFGALLAPMATESNEPSELVAQKTPTNEGGPTEAEASSVAEPTGEKEPTLSAAPAPKVAKLSEPKASVREDQPNAKVVDRWRPPVAVVAPPVGYQNQPSQDESGVVRHTTEVASAAPKAEVPKLQTKSQTLHWKPKTAANTSSNVDSNVAQAGAVEKTALYMTRAQVRSLTIRGHLHKVSVDDRSVCQAVAAGPNQIKLIGTGNGVAELVVWASVGRNTETISRAFDIHVSDPVEASSDPASEKLSVLSQSIQHAFPNSDVTIQLLTDKMVITGQCTSEDAAKKIVRMVRRTCLVPVIDELKVR